METQSNFRAGANYREIGETMGAELSYWESTGLFDNIDMCLFSRDIVNDRYISISKGCEDIYGYSVEHFLNNPVLWYEVIMPEDTKLLQMQAQSLSKGNKGHLEYRIIHSDGSIRWVEEKVVPVISEDGRLIRVDGIINDISERKAAEIEILKQKQFSEAIINSLPGVFYLFDMKGRYKFWNKNLEDVSGYSGAEIKQMAPLDFIADEGKELVSARISEVFQTGRGVAEASLRTKNNEHIPYFYTGKKIEFQGEDHLVGMGIDISDRKEAEEQLHKNEEMLNHILNTIPQAIFWKDTESRYLGYNSVFAKDSGAISANSLIGKTDFELCSFEQAQKFQHDDRVAMHSGKPKLHYIEVQKRHDNELVWVDTCKIPLKNSKNEVVGLLGITEDITERKLEEERQKKINEDLVQKNIGLKQFSYIVSHNLRAPITKILGLADLFEKDIDSSALNQELVEYIATEARNLDDVVKDLNMILNGQDLTNKAHEQVVFADVLKLVVQSLELEILANDVKILASFDEAAYVNTVRAYFYSILYNLVSNAIKYRSPIRNLIIELTSTMEEQYICFSVKDNGIGIDLDKYGSKIFGLYNRFHSSSAKGRGIGLNLVKTQIETLGGKVEINSKVGEGTTFKVYFPTN